MEVEEALILSTCNRVEVYLVPARGVEPQSIVQPAREVWAELINADLELVAQHTQVWSGDAAILHAFEVMCSLDSLVIGEAQILGQTKDGYRIADEAGTLGAGLRTLFEHGFGVAKKVRTDTGIGRASVSISSVAVSLAQQIFDPMDNVRVLLLGAGKMAALAARNLQEAGAGAVTIVNRTYRSAERLAERYNWKVRHFEDVDLLLPEVDIVISSTGASKPLIDRSMVQNTMRKRRYRPLFFIDIAVPRDIDPSVVEVDRIFLYNIDDLEEIANRNLNAREADIEAARSLIVDGIERFERRKIVEGRQPFLKRMALHVDSVRNEELEKALQRLELNDPRAEKIVFQLAHNISQRLTRGAYKVVKSGETDDVDRVTDVIGQAFEVPEIDPNDGESDASVVRPKVLPIRTGTNDDSSQEGG
jgi:glutamyl-tRNA reductase